MTRFLTDLKKAHKDTAHMKYMVHGLGDKLKLVALNKNFSKLNKRKVLEDYSRATNRILFFDNEGTLSNFMKQIEIDKKIGPSKRTLKALEGLCDDGNNTIFVVTGRAKNVVENWFGSIACLGMAAEYGALIRWPGCSEWNRFFTIKGDWKEMAKEVISGYSERTEGAQLVEKESSVVFLYREAEVEFGSYQAKELVSQLDFLLNPFMDQIEISEGFGYVEVKPKGINKGTAVYKAIEKINSRQGPVDFIMAIGDDSSDEEMFKMLKAIKKQNSIWLVHKKIPIYTCTLGIKPSLASHFLLDAAKVLNLLEFINGHSAKAKMNFSHNDLATKFQNVRKKLEKLKVFEDYSGDEIPRTESYDAVNKKSK